MSVGIDGCIGKPLIRESRGLDVYVRRSLRDVFRKVPTFCLEVKVGFLHGVMSNKEYDVILNCTHMNLNETPRLPPSFRGSKSGSKDTMRLLVDKVNMNSQMLLSRSVTIVAVEVNCALLELRNGIHEESPLARIALEGLWVSYRMTSLSETDLYVTIPTFSVLDIRPNTKPEMRLMLGSSVDASKQASTGNLPLFINKSSFSKVNFEAGLDLDVPVSTMFLMDYRWRLSSQSFVLRVQQPRVLVVPDFLLALGEFFVPALGAITGREETMDPKNDPISKNNSIVLSDSIYKQNEDVVYLSPSRQLIADTHGIDEYTYDGCGKTIFLSEEIDKKELHSERFRPIVIIGRGKRLRFVNVKIENGSLLRKYTYLSTDSSYSVSQEDGVDISLMDKSSSDDEKKIVENLDKLINSPKTDSYLQDDPKVVQSFTFEAQVVAPEFTFFDGTKSYLDDTSSCEKLLRAKMDLNFMYASKGNDIWIRALVKDLTIEAGSGLIILDPLDISGGFTSIKEKTNMSLISTDICFRLSLSAISLLLNLQNQAAAALQFGNAIPLAPCTNFDRIWVSPKENGSHNNLTIWRPQAPSNYVILGDCVTSRPIPPSQAVLAVSNTYGRVRKPVGFNLIGFFSHVLGFEGVDGHTDVDSDCSLWMPVAPPGYISMGCVANIGKHPPPTHTVYCLRSDLVTSTTCSECMLNVPSNQQFNSGFSIWRLDNVLGSFYAHSSTECPPKENSSDLSHLLLWNSVWSYAFLKESVPVDNDHASQQMGNQGVGSSGWDILRSISKATSCYVSTPQFERMWWDKGGDLRRPVSIWRPISRRGYAIVGDCITEGLEPPALGIIFKSDDPEISAKPVQFTKVAHITGKGFDEVFFWYPIAPPGYASLGCIVSRTDEAPCMDLACTFLARSDIKKPSTRLAYTIGDSVKPKTRENVTAEIKLRYFSLTVLDSLHGMMTPLFDMTITNIKLATHGRLEAMNAVLISSIAASTFNTQLEAWEPLVEPFDGIFKFETYETNVDGPSKLGKRMRIAATNIVNINVSAANLDTLVETILSWRRQLELEQKATKLIEDAGGPPGHEDLTFSALDEEDLQTVIVENKLGNDMFLKRIEQNSELVDQLQHGDAASVWIPPARFSDRLNVAEGSREERYYVAVQILVAKDLPIIDDGNSYNFFCALRLVIDSQATDQQKLFPQSARTKCVKPLISDTEYPNKGNAKWNELFIFEVPRKGVAKLEVEVTNLSAKAGKGEVVGALSFRVGHGASLKKVSSARMLSQKHDVQNIESYPLRRKTNSVEDMLDSGYLFVSTSYFERITTANFLRNAESKDASDKDIGFWVKLGTEDSWESIRSLLPVSVVPKSLQSEFIAMEVVMKNGKKHCIFRGLATVVNDSDVNLDISDPVLILDLSSSAHTSSFWMFHQQSKRRLRVSIERDMGGTSAAPKTIRFFVPYWIINDSSLPLAYQVVEIEGSDTAEMDSHSLSRAVKSARTVLRTSSYSMERRHSGLRRNIQVLEAIEDTSPIASMLSPQDSAGRSGVMLFPSQKDTYVSPRVGIAVAIRNSEIFSPGISLLELEKKERVDVKAFNYDGSYYKLSALVNMTSDRTKVIHLQPQMLFINRVGFSLCLQQCDSDRVEWIHPTDPPKPFGWQSSSKVELLKLRVDGYKWSTPFSVSSEGVMRVSLKNDTGSYQLLVKVEVRSGTKSSRYEVVFRPNSSSSPYRLNLGLIIQLRIENRSIFLPLRCRQVDGTSDSWHFLLPNTAVSFLWEDLGRRHLLEILADGTDPSRSQKYNIDEIFDHQPIDVTGPARALRVTILKEEKVNVVKISDWMPENEPTAIIKQSAPSSSEFYRNESHQQQLQSTSECEFHVIVELAELGVSIIDHTPEEILYMSVQNLHLAYSTGLGSGFSRFKLRMRGIQMDNQLPLTPTPVLFRPQRIGNERDYMLKISVTLLTNGSMDLCVYPYIGLHGPDNSAFLINIHEPIIWRIHEMIQQVNLSRLYDSSKTTAVSVDPIIQIGVLNISEFRLKVSMTMSPSQRPRGVLGFWSSLMTALGNTENMTVRINQRFHENVCMRQSTMISNAISNVKKDLLGQPLQLLSGLDILGNASSALGHMSKGVAALSMDKKFIQSRQRQEKGVEDLGDVIREGGGALAKGLFRGVTGILTKPLEGAKSSGVEGFVQGVGKGLIGAAAQPVSGVLDLLSKTTEGANAMRMKIASAIASDDQLLRRRLPRVISGDNLLRPYDDYKAQGQVILQLAESGSFFGQVDLFKVRGKFALSDAYEDHFLLPKGKILMVTHRRIILLQQTSHITQRKFNPARDPCSVLWDVMWDDLATMELTQGKKDQPKAPPSRLILYLKSRATDAKEQVRIIKCSRDTRQALEVYSSVEQAMNTYGPNLCKELVKKKVTKPYSPVTDGSAVEMIAKEGAAYTWSPQQVPTAVPNMRSTFGSGSN
ncbi:hypothetical protein COLO4_34529 [Corchorus olitorius]|uniref:Uncharacterized protein n=1 Tax=Corchorus olitorius TaxID=93759 RepID=A0A1R3GKE7_9ROSI|nr:hypothetical protein COLO4_34529 [Corchorus olitorius]